MTGRVVEGERILVIDDEEHLRHMLGVLLARNGYQVEQAENGREGLSMAVAGEYDYILCDIRMPELEGTEFLQQAQASGVTATIIMMSAYGTVDTALECMQLGAYDYISKPFKNDEVILVLRKAAERERLKRENERLRREVVKEYSFANMIGGTAQMREVFAMVERVCNLKTTVLLLGESGTGKELVARAIHYQGARARAPFIAVNCGAIPETLLESELFGHVRGAFTDAGKDKAGLFEQADGGTLLLDEIGEMPLALQVKLLRVLQEGEVRRIGAASSRKVDVRVISATARDLSQEVAAGRFREDLYYRLNVFSIRLPPLRERVEDIPRLAEHFLKKHAEKLGRPQVRLASETRRRLLRYAWPGNVRELENCIERALILCDGDRLEPVCLPEAMVSLEEGGQGLPAEGAVLEGEELSIPRAAEQLERDFIRRALERTNGNRTHAAKLLEISLRGLLYKMKEYGIE